MNAGIREENRRRERVIAKLERIDGLKALVKEHEEAPETDHDYLRGLRERLRKARVELDHLALPRNER